jgi:hypothetical protein
MENCKISWLLVCTILGTIIGLGIGKAIYQPEEPHTDAEIQDLETKYTVDDFNQDYAVDLKQDGFLVVDEQGECYFVPHEQLETWFLEMNL